MFRSRVYDPRKTDVPATVCFVRVVWWILVEIALFTCMRRYLSRQWILSCKLHCTDAMPVLQCAGHRIYCFLIFVVTFFWFLRICGSFSLISTFWYLAIGFRFDSHYPASGKQLTSNIHTKYLYYLKSTRMTMLLKTSQWKVLLDNKWIIW